MIKGKRILITGATGFIGAYFARELCEKNDVALFIRPSSERNDRFWRINDILSKVSMTKLDMLDAESVKNEVKLAHPDMILHLAAYGNYPRSQQACLEMINTNILCTFNLLESAIETSVESFINIGSSSEYGFKTEPMKETDMLEPENMYGATKAFGTLYARLRAKETGMKINTVRPFSVYGPYEDKNRLIPYVILSAMKNAEIELSNKNNVRDFIFIEDVFEACTKLLDSDLCGETLNVGSGIETRIENVVDKILRLIKTGSIVKWDARPSTQAEPRHWCASMDKTKNLLDWEPKYTLEEGLEKTIEWFKERCSK